MTPKTALASALSVFSVAIPIAVGLVTTHGCAGETEPESDDLDHELAIENGELDIIGDESKTEPSDSEVEHEASVEFAGEVPTQEYTCHGSVCDCGWGASSCNNPTDCAADCDDLKNACDEYGAGARWECDQGCTCVGYGENECCCGTCTVL